MTTDVKQSSASPTYVVMTLAAAFLLPLLYLLSLPLATHLVVRICSGGRHEWFALSMQTIYSPIIWLVRSNQLFAQYYCTYLDFWGVGI